MANKNKNSQYISDAMMALMRSSIAKTNDVRIPKTLSDTSEEHEDYIREYTKDAYENSLLGIGGKDKTEEFTKYGFSNNTLNFYHWLALYNDSWVFRRAIDKPAQDMVRQGFTLIGNSDFTPIYKRYNQAKTDLAQTLQWGRLFGGSVMVLLFDKVQLDQMYQSIDKFIKEKVITPKSAFKSYITDRWYGLQWSTETVTKVGDDDFSKPKYYTVTFADGKQYRIHYSWVLRYEHRIAPKLIKMGMLQGWGYAEGSHILNELNRDEKLKNSIQSLIDKSLIEVIKMSGMRGVFMGADNDNEEQLRKRLEMVNWGRNFNSLTFLDSSDDYQMNTFSGLAGLADILQQNMWQIAAALEMQGVLFGDMKQGFSNDSEALTRYNETITINNDAYFRPILTKFLRIWYKVYGIEEDVDYSFNSLITQKDDSKLEDANKLGELLSKGITDGYVTPQLAALTLKKYSEKIGLEIPIDDDYIKKLDNEIKQQEEDLDKAFEEEDENTYLSDAYLTDLTHVNWIERKYKRKYPKMRVVWYEVDPRKQDNRSYTLTPSLYIFNDENPPFRGSGAYRTSIRFSDHPTNLAVAHSEIITPYNRDKFEKACDRFIANNPKMMEGLYGSK